MKIRQELSGNEDTLVYGFAGKYIDRKNPFEFIEAIEKAHQRDPRVRGIMIGGGDLESEINQRLSQLGNAEVINLGFVNQAKIPLYYAAMDVFVVTSWIDPHPLVVSEAMVSGTPPILSDRCGNWGYNDTVRHRYNGLIYPCGNSDVLADRMLEMTDIGTRKHYSTKSKEVFYEQDIYCEVKAFLEVIERIKRNRHEITREAKSLISPRYKNTVPN